jgi:large subunit ribosomal protein L21
MYAVIETGGKQYRVSPGQTVEVELLPEAPGNRVELDRVLLVSADGRTLVGRPTVPDARVVATVAREGRGKKIIVFKFKAKKRYRRKRGHRQSYTYLVITDIQAEGKSLVPDVERQRYERSARRQAARYEARLAGIVDALAFDAAVGDLEAVGRDENRLEDEGDEAELAAERGTEPVDDEADTETESDAGGAADAPQRPRKR